MPGRPHMPRLYHRIHDHLVKKGFTDKQAWAIAVEAIAKGCTTGDTNFPGKQEMGTIGRTRYCNAYREWRRTHKGTGFGKAPGRG